jgi:hypothetical protein
MSKDNGGTIVFAHGEGIWSDEIEYLSFVLGVRRMI